MSNKGLTEALTSSQAMDDYLEANTAQEIIDDIRQAMQPERTLRDYFAASCLSGVMTSATGLASVSDDEVRRMLDDVARILYIAADAMLAAREAKP